MISFLIAMGILPGLLNAGDAKGAFGTLVINVIYFIFISFMYRQC